MTIVYDLNEQSVLITPERAVTLRLAHEVISEP